MDGGRGECLWEGSWQKDVRRVLNFLPDDDR